MFFIFAQLKKWGNLEKVTDKAKDSCQNAGKNIDDHLPDVTKTIPMHWMKGICNSALSTGKFVIIHNHLL
jgi:hypothetical protein